MYKYSDNHIPYYIIWLHLSNSNFKSCFKCQIELNHFTKLCPSIGVKFCVLIYLWGGARLVYINYGIFEKM